MFPGRPVEELLPDPCKIVDCIGIDRIVMIVHRVMGRLCFGLLLGFVVSVSWIGMGSGMELALERPVTDSIGVQFSSINMIR